MSPEASGKSQQFAIQFLSKPACPHHDAWDNAGQAGEQAAGREESPENRAQRVHLEKQVKEMWVPGH